MPAPPSDSPTRTVVPPPDAPGDPATRAIAPGPGEPLTRSLVELPDRPADQEQPAEQDRDGEAREQRQGDRKQTQNDQDDALDEKQLPVLADRLRERIPRGIE